MLSNFKRKILDRYREIHPKSRAVNFWTYYGSTGCVRKATCIFCRNVVATCSNKWPETKTFLREAEEHCEGCSVLWWLNGQVYDLKKNESTHITFKQEPTKIK